MQKIGVILHYELFDANPKKIYYDEFKNKDVHCKKIVVATLDANDKLFITDKLRFTGDIDYLNVGEIVNCDLVPAYTHTVKPRFELNELGKKQLDSVWTQLANRLKAAMLEYEQLQTYAGVIVDLQNQRYDSIRRKISEAKISVDEVRKILKVFVSYYFGEIQTIDASKTNKI